MFKAILYFPVDVRTGGKNMKKSSVEPFLLEQKTSVPNDMMLSMDVMFLQWRKKTKTTTYHFSSPTKKNLHVPIYSTKNIKNHNLTHLDRVAHVFTGNLLHPILCPQTPTSLRIGTDLKKVEMFSVDTPHKAMGKMLIFAWFMGILSVYPLPRIPVT